MQWGVWLSGLWADAINFVHAWLSDFASRWSEFTTWFEGMRKNIEPVTWVLGSVLALVPGSFAIYKWVYYRYSRLPDRLDDMLEREERRLRDARDHLLRAMQRPAPTKKFRAPIFVVPSLSRALQRLKWAHWRSGRRLPAADVELGAALAEIEQQERYWHEKRASYSRQKVTAYLLRGAIAAAHGTKARVNGIDGEQHSRDALDYFNKALEIASDDHQALEYKAQQQRVLGMLDEALSSYGQLLDLVADKRGDPQLAELYMRVQRYRGEILWKQFTDKNVQLRLAQAKACLEDALNSMPTVARDEIDHACILLCLGKVEAKRETQLWINHFLRAESIFSSLIQRKRDVKEARAGIEEVKRLQREFASAVDRTSGGGPLDSPPDIGAPPNGPH